MTPCTQRCAKAWVLRLRTRRTIVRARVRELMLYFSFVVIFTLSSVWLTADSDRYLAVRAACATADTRRVMPPHAGAQLATVKNMLLAPFPSGSSTITLTDITTGDDFGAW